ncbi:MAG: DUF4962 domain-containing protein, partial [Armatimonadota bacterium]
MRRLIPAMVLIVLAVACPAQQIPLRNPSFEADEDGDGMPDGWRFATHGEGWSAGITDAEAHSGEHSIFITGAPDHGDRAAVLQVSPPVKVSPGYRLRFFARGTGHPGSGILRFRYPIEGDDVKHQTERFQIRAAEDEWTENVFEFAAGPTAREIGVSPIEIILYQRGEGTLYYDDVSVEPLSEAPQPELSPAQRVLQTRRRPVDGRVALQNPPDFTWEPQPRAERYELQLARSEDFSDAVTIENLEYNCYSHSALLDSDARWWWRFRYRQDGRASEWSEAWSFDVAPDAYEFPVPRPAELLARVPRSHPRVYATAVTLEQFRAPRLGEKADWWEQFEGRCEAHLDKDIPEEPGPEYDFSGRSGALTAAEKSRKDALRGLGGRASSPMWEMGFGYLVSENEEFGEGAVEWLMGLSEWGVEGTTGYRNHDQVFRDIAWKSACVYDWCYDLMSEDERATAREMIEARGSILYHDFREDSRPIYEYPYNSHGWTSMGFLGIISIALCHDEPRANDWFSFIAATYAPLYPAWAGEEGGWCQGTAYWKYSQRYRTIFSDALLSATGVDLYDKAFTRNNGWFKPYMHPPFCDRHHFGDGNLGSPGATDRNNQLLYATRYDNPYFKWYADQIHGSEDTG